MGSNQVQQVKEAIDIVEVIQQRVTLQHGGRNLKGLCPFHSEKSPSFFVNPEMQMYKCFGCGASGDVYSFLQAYEGMTFPEALEYAADAVGITLTQQYKSEPDKTRDRILELLELAGQYYQYLLLEHSIGHKAREYCQSRGITLNIQKQFGLGYSLQSWTGIIDYLHHKKNYSMSEISQAGLVVTKGGRSYDRFRGRLMFPLYNHRKQLVGFSGRVLDADEKQAKYINSPETLLYRKRELLFGYTQAKQAIRKANSVLVVEGELDVLASHKASVSNCVAVKGAALTAAQVTLLKRIAETLILSLDADEAGQQAIQRAIPIVQQAGCQLRVLQIAGGKDPDDIVQHNPADWRELSKQSVSVYQYYLDRAVALYDSETGDGQRSITQFVLPIFALIENQVEQSYYLQKLADVLSVSLEVVSNELRRTIKDKKLNLESHTSSKQPVSESYQAKNRVEALEQHMLALALHKNLSLAEFRQVLHEDVVLQHSIQKLLKESSELPASTSLAACMQVMSKPLQDYVKQVYGSEQQLFEQSEVELSERWEHASMQYQRESAKSRLKQISEAMKEAATEQELKRLQIEYRKVSALLHQE